eukprot:TRINITY_DN2597_c1_g2_i1.p1 TRINITY_DN2597_c1_g2~~TRINITY_DN2597_c1_g2_i1.p1  ORF type:complete len:352 (+),score=76.73 TRINITY_DN2597_c1_g2_i1:69-1058(+)
MATKAKAVLVHTIGGPEVLQYQEVDKPKIVNPKDVLVKNVSIGVNFIDTYHRNGVYKVNLPYIIGRDGSGTIEEIGSEVKKFKVGDRIAYPGCIPGSGSYAEYSVVSSDFSAKIPESVSFETATAAMVQGLTAHYLLRSSYPVKKGETILVHAAAGGLGQALTQAAKHIGARVIGTVSTQEKADLARANGCDEVILYSQQDFVEETLKLTDRKGVQAIYDSVGTATFDKGFGCLQRRGFMVLCGNASGKPTTLDLNLVAAGSKYMTRASLGDYMTTPEEFEGRVTEVFQWLESGVLKPQIGLTLPLKDAAKAHTALEARQTTGKVLLKP